MSRPRKSLLHDLRIRVLMGCVLFAIALGNFYAGGQIGNAEQRLEDSRALQLLSKTRVDLAQIRKEQATELNLALAAMTRYGFGDQVAEAISQHQSTSSPVVLLEDSEAPGEFFLSDPTGQTEVMVVVTEDSRTPVTLQLNVTGAKCQKLSVAIRRLQEGDELAVEWDGQEVYKSSWKMPHRMLVARRELVPQHQFGCFPPGTLVAHLSNYAARASGDTWCRIHQSQNHFRATLNGGLNNLNEAPPSEKKVEVEVLIRTSPELLIAADQFWLANRSMNLVWDESQQAYRVQGLRP